MENMGTAWTLKLYKLLYDDDDGDDGGGCV